VRKNASCFILLACVGGQVGARSVPALRRGNQLVFQPKYGAGDVAERLKAAVC
jgi:hypothetical protein